MSTEERLERLEQELCAVKRRTRWLLSAVGVGLMALALAWTLANTPSTAQAQGAAAVPKEIRANKIILEDLTGKARAMLTVDADEAGLIVLDENGKGRAMLTVDKEGVGLVMTDEIGKGRVGLVVHNGNPLLTLKVIGGGQAALGVGEGGKAGALLLDNTGKPIWSAP
jgi:hypothetical protein